MEQLLDFLDDPEEANQTIWVPAQPLYEDSFARVTADDCGMDVSLAYTMLAVMSKTAQNIDFLRAAVKEKHRVKLLDVPEDGGGIFCIKRTESDGIYRILNVWTPTSAPLEIHICGQIRDVIAPGNSATLTPFQYGTNVDGDSWTYKLIFRRHFLESRALFPPSFPTEVPIGHAVYPQNRLRAAKHRNREDELTEKITNLTDFLLCGVVCLKYYVRLALPKMADNPGADVVMSDS